VIRTSPIHTAWDSQALDAIVNGSMDKNRVRIAQQTAPIDSERCAALMREFCVNRGIPLRIFASKCRNAGVVQARREVWHYLYCQCVFGFLTLEWVTNFSHSNIIDSLKEFVPTHELLALPAEVAA